MAGAVPGGAIHVTQSAATWIIVATDGTGYATKALLDAASKTAWPGLDPGMFPAQIDLGSENGSGAAGDDFYFAFNKGAAFSDLANDGLRDNLAIFVPTGSHWSQPGVDENNNFMVWNLWVRKITAGDEVVVSTI